MISPRSAKHLGLHSLSFITHHPFHHHYVDIATTGNNTTLSGSNLPYVTLFPSHT